MNDKFWQCIIFSYPFYIDVANGNLIERFNIIEDDNRSKMLKIYLFEFSWNSGKGFGAACVV